MFSWLKTLFRISPRKPAVEMPEPEEAPEAPVLEAEAPDPQLPEADAGEFPQVEAVEVPWESLSEQQQAEILKDLPEMPDLDAGDPPPRNIPDTFPQETENRLRAIEDRAAIADKDEKPPILLGDGEGTHVTPETILPSTFETEAAQTDTWDVDDQDEGEDGVSVRLQTRTTYDDTSDE